MEKILIVEDDKFSREILEEELSDQNFEVLMAVDGKQALEFIEENEIDLILLDIMMPKISGLDVLKKIREQHSILDLPVIMVTAKDQSEDIIKALGMKANDYMIKPIDFPVLLSRIQTHLTLRRLSKQKDEFLRIASHDLKNPLSIIFGMARVLKEMTQGEVIQIGLAREFSQKIMDASEQMESIISDYLDFQALEDGEFQLEIKRIDLNLIAKHFLEPYKILADSKEIELILDYENHLPEVLADFSRLGQIMGNLVSNAIKFSPHKSEIKIRTGKKNKQIFFEVEDSGPGFSKEDMKMVFSKYARLSNKPTGGEGGSGLGLAICKLLIDKQNGKIGLKNNPKKGSTFWITLPLP